MRSRIWFQRAVAWSATWVSDQPGSSALRLAAASGVLTKERATFMVIVREAAAGESVSKLT